MFALLCRAIILVYIVQCVYTDRYLASSGGKDKFYIYKNRMASLASRPVMQEDKMSYTSCIDTCDYMGKNCLTVTVLKNNTENFRCTYYDNDTLSFQMAPNNLSTYVIRKGQGHCGEHCDRLKSSKPCGNCRCRDTCGPAKLYQCDCTENVVVKKSCEEIFASGGQINGRYLINPDGNGSFEVICHIQQKDYQNRNICKMKANTWAGSPYPFALTYIFQDEISCRQYCFSFWKQNHYNGWIYAPYYCLCDITSQALQSYNDVHSSCMIELSPSSFNIINMPTTVMLRRHSDCDPSYWNKPLSSYNEGFISGDNIWIGLYQLERITSAFKVDIKVLLVDGLFNDTITTYYKNVKVKRTTDDGDFVITVESFDSNGARVEGFYDSNQFLVNTPFKSCDSLGAWWMSCSSPLQIPTAFNDKFGFGKITDIHTLTFLLLLN